MKGWYLVAFESEVIDELTPTYIGKRRLMLVRHGGRVRAFDAVCPHRGANLSYGGRLCQNAIVCPFHGYRIQLGDDGQSRLFVSEYPVLISGGMVFVRLSQAHDNGWARFLEDTDREQFIINGFKMSVRAPMETVIDNAFDRRHFQAVHGIRTDDFVVWTSELGALIVESTFYLPTGTIGTGRHSVSPVPYKALVVSPGLVAVELGGPAPYTVITGATDTPDGECEIRLSLTFPKETLKTPPPPAVYEPLLRQSRRGLEDDNIIWENLSPLLRPKWMLEDFSSLQFFEFCKMHYDSCDR